MKKIFTFWLTLLPLVVWQDHYEVPKVFWMLLGGIFVLIYLIFNIKKVILTKRDYWYLLMLSWLSISSLFSQNIKLSLLGGSYRHQGVIFFFCLWILIKLIELFSRKEKTFLFKCMAIVILIESLLVFPTKSLGTIGEANAVSGFIAIGISFVTINFSRWVNVLPISSLIFIFSRSGLLALIPYVFKRSYLKFIIPILILIFIIKPINNNSIFENRLVIWKHSVNLIIKNPILGYGAESNEFLFDKAFFESGFPLYNLMIDRSHNLFLDITLWSGIIGLFFFIGFLIESYKQLETKIFVNERRSALLSFLIYSMFQPLSIAHWILLVLII